MTGDAQVWSGRRVEGRELARRKHYRSGGKKRKHNTFSIEVALVHRLKRNRGSLGRKKGNGTKDAKSARGKEGRVREDPQRLFVTTRTRKRENLRGKF